MVNEGAGYASSQEGERMMVRWMCGVTLRSRVTSDQLPSEWMLTPCLRLYDVMDSDGVDKWRENLMMTGDRSVSS